MDTSTATVAHRKKNVSALQDRIIVLCLVSFSFVFLLVLTNAWPARTHDGLIHMHRIRALADALRAGVLFPRWFPDFTFDYGYPVLNYYPPLFYYPSALLRLVGLEMVLSLRLPISVGFAFSAWWMYRFAREFFSVWPAVVCVICYQFYPYRMLDLLERGAFPEFAAFMWLPLVALYGIRAAAARPKTNVGLSREPGIAAQEQGSYRKFLAWAGLAFACLILTHSLTALMTVIVMAIVLAMFVLLRHREGLVSRFSAGYTAAGIAAVGILLSSWFTLPVLFELKWVGIGRGFAVGTWMDHMAGWSDLFEPALIYSYRYSDPPTFFLPIYTIPIGIAALYIVLAAKSRSLRLITLVTLLSTILVTWLTTASSLWLWASAEFLFEKLQFPWRWQVFVSFGTSLLLAASLEQLLGLRKLPGKTVPIILTLLSAYIVIYSTLGLDYPVGDDPRNEGISAPGLWKLNSRLGERDSEGNRMGSWPREFMPVWVEVDPRSIGGPPWDKPIMPDSNETLEVVPIRGGLLKHQYQVTTQQTFRLLFHQFYFPSWRVTLDGVQAKVEPASQLALASVEIPPGTHDVVLEWGPTRTVWFGRILTVAGWFIVLALLYVDTRQMGTSGANKGAVFEPFRRYWPLGGWLAFGALIVVVASGIADRHWVISEIGADYGNIRLEGVRPPPPTRAGEVAPVHLTWAVKTAGVPVSTFVHLVDESGMGVSQHDGPPGGLYTPYQRWEPGLMLNSTHNIVVPDTLAPGTYRLIAGLYFPDISHEPLVPAKGETARLEIGVLQVLPK